MAVIFASAWDYRRSSGSPPDKFSVMVTSAEGPADLWLLRRTGVTPLMRAEPGKTFCFPSNLIAAPPLLGRKEQKSYPAGAAVNVPCPVNPFPAFRNTFRAGWIGVRLLHHYHAHGIFTPGATGRAGRRPEVCRGPGAAPAFMGTSASAATFLLQGVQLRAAAFRSG